MNNYKKIILVLAGVLITGGALFAWKTTANQQDTPNDNNSELVLATVYKSPTCGCCVKHSAYLKDNGFAVQIEKTDDMSAVKAEHQIPQNMESCHTTVIGDYFIEGHVPIEAIEKLLTEKPDIDGIALPDMPAGSPGMPGIKTRPFEIFSIKDGQTAKYLSI
ncbi:MAG: DUF411 domain-containing protein [Patescibacteria group bacterium]